VHLVQSGETLYSIARKYDVSVTTLSQLNGLTSMSYLHPDDELVIPAESEGPLPTASRQLDEILHTVQEGERLADIAQRYGISAQELLSENGLEAGSAVRPGDKLAIPLDNGPAPTATRAATPTATPGPLYEVPHLLYPPQNAQFEGAEESVLLQWTSSGILEEDEWYALSLRYLGYREDGQPSEIAVYTKITSWRLPEQWYPGAQAAERRFEWTVQVVRRKELGQPPAAISVPSEVRRFHW
jgi:LysM repeat protein